MHRRLLRTALTAALVAGMSLLVAPVPVSSMGAAAEKSEGDSTAWRDGALQVDTEGLISRSDLILEQAPWRDYESMPLGNGHLGAAVWAEHGFTAQLNRNDTFPELKSAGQLVIPGLFDLSAADDYAGRLDMYDAQLRQSGAGLTALSYVRAEADQLVVEVTGADPDQPQTVELRLWEDRAPATYAEGGVAALAETFTDEQSGITTGAVAAVTAVARDVVAEVVDEQTVRLTFRPAADGSFRVVTGVPAYTGGDVAAAAADALAGAEADVEATHLAWWSDFWATAAPMRIGSDDGVGEYMENLRVQQLYTTAATQRADVPTGQAGAANMLYPFEDQMISPAFWFHFNLRQQVFANFGAGTAEFNDAYLSLYNDRLPQMLDWTRQVWPDTEGVCVPELLRFDGTGGACDGEVGPAFLNRVISTGPEVAHNIWKQYLYTGDEAVLDEGYPLMREVVRFYLSLLEEGDDGRVHLHNVNSLETQWDTTDPTPDVAAMKVLFPIVAELAADRGDDELADELLATIPKLPEFTTTTRNGVEVMAWSATDEPAKNTQNVDLEPLMPWNLFGIDSQLMRDTFEQRVFPLTREWDESPSWAARLGLPDDMERLLVEGTVDLQKFPNGFTGHGKNDDPASIHNYYSSWSAVVAGALQEALVQAHEGVVRIAPSWVDDWDVDGSVVIPGGHVVSTQVRDGAPNHVGIQAGSDETLRIANPWPGERIRVVDGADPDHSVVRPTNADEIELAVEDGASYLVERVGDPLRSFRFDEVGGEPAAEARHLGGQTLGVESSTPEIRSDVVDVVAPSYLDRLVRAEDGVDHLLESSNALPDLPDALEGTAMVRGAPDDAENAEPADYLTLDLSQPADVYVALDQRGDGTWWPDWLEEQGFTRTDMTIDTHDFLQRVGLEPDGRMRVSGSGVTLIDGENDWSDQVLEVTLQQVQVGTGVMFRAPDSRNGYVWQIGGDLGSDGGLGQLQMYTMIDGRLTRIGQVNPIEPGAGNEYDLRVEATGDRIRTFINGELVDDRRDSTFASGAAGIRQAGSEVGEFDQFTVSAPDGSVLFDDDFSGDLSAWNIPADRQNVPLVVWTKQLPAGRVSLGPNSGIDGEGEAPYVTFIDETP
ncbi:glycosyl hydrolase family 95 catalytic domain-containing protein [Jiangella asiatica]|uniref:Glycosyl hydrolase family 95 catalytic domain-containing protein n=1 Tax=Jiangella asiatica TaxID=2530372 RepID=A0A4R5DV29_9ACTN|nr:hypothetical protein [Jiangella asiatica]TDE16011.1 hypothetical protein E1269_01630 [Jiangella asiatica]